MDMKSFEEQQQIQELRLNVLRAEQERISDAKTLSVAEAKENLKKRIEKKKLIK